MKYTDFETWHNEQMMDPAYKKAYHELDEEFAVIEKNIQKQIEIDKTKIQIMNRNGINQSQKIRSI